jgi:hypothetical protein
MFSINLILQIILQQINLKFKTILNWQNNYMIVLVDISP